MQATISLQENPNPMLLTFPQNIPKHLEDLEVSLLVHERPTKTRKAVIINDKKVSWVGKLQETNEPHLMLGVLKEGTIKLYPSFGQFTMHQYIHKQVGAHQSLMTQNIGDANLSHFEKQKLLAEEMGTKKAKRKTRAMETNRVQEENISKVNEIQEVFNAKKDDLKEQTQVDQMEQEQTLNQARKDLLPHFNPHEKDPSKVFDVTYQIIINYFLGDLEAIDVQATFVAVTKKAENLMNAIKILDQHCKNIVLEKVESLQEKSTTQKMLVLKYIKYFTNILLKFNKQLRFNDKTPEDIARQVKVKEIPVVKNILSRFYLATKGNVQNPQSTQNDKLNYSRSAQLNDKYICYLIVLHLIIYDFSFDGQSLANTLKQSPQKFINYCKECGCTVVQSKNKAGDSIIQVKLQAPIKFPKISSGKAR